MNMKKKITLLACITFCNASKISSLPANPAAAVAVAATTPKDSMVKGTQQRVVASNIKIKRNSPHNKNLPVVKVWKSLENPHELIITGLNTGSAEIIVEQNLNGTRTFKTFIILVKEKDSFLDRFKKAWNEA